MANNTSFDMYKFNRLPRQLVDTALSAEQNLIDSLPYIFKPNRVLALHPKYKDVDAGFPFRDKRMRWAIKLNIPEIFAQYTYIITINREAWLSIWRYQPENKTGLFQVPLKAKHIHYDDSIANILLEQNVIYLTPPKLGETELARRLPYDFNVLRLTQHCDEDGLVTVKLMTNEHEHIIKLDFGHYQFINNQNLQYSHTINKANSNQKIIRQIGDWDGKKTFFWQDFPPNLKTGHIHAPKIIDFPMKIYRFWAVIEQKVQNKIIRVLGGEGHQLYWYEDGKYKNLNINKKIQGDIRSLALLPAEQCGQDYPLIVVGSNDLYLYIITHAGKILQKANMGGSVDGLLYLNANKQDWFDLVVLVRNEGLMCVRLFFDEFKLDVKVKSKKETWYKLMKKLLEQHDLLSYLESEDINHQLLAITYISYHLSEDNLKFFEPSEEILCQLNSQAKVYLLHRIRQQLLNEIIPPDNNAVMEVYHRDTKKIEHSLTLFSYMAKSDYFSRLLVMSIKGWLLSFSQSKKLSEERVINVVSEVPDTKRLLQSVAKKIVKNTNTTDIGHFVSTWEFLNYKRNFNELIVIDQDKRNRVDSMAMLQTHDPKRGCVNIYSLYGQNKLSDFSSLASFGNKYIFQEMGWNKNLQHMKNIHCLLTVKNKILIAVADHGIGIVTEQQKDITWQIPKPDTTLWSAAYHPNYEQDTGLLAVGGEWHQGLSPIFTFKLGVDNKLIPIQINRLSLPKDWKGRTRFSQLKWDNEGGLWAVTGDKGELFHWVNAFSNIQNQKPTIAKHLASNGNTQNALMVLNNKVICGGYEGVVRAFNLSGQLLWANVYDTPIRAITSVQDNEETNRQPCADLAIAIEKEGLVLCNEDGIQQGHLLMSNRFIANMVSRIASKNGVQHHLVGMYTGEVRLVEEVPQNWTPQDYLIKPQGKLLPDDWKNIETQIKQLSTDKDLCTKWCSVDDTIKEPYRAIWASRQLIIQHNTFKVVIDLLKNGRIKQRQDPVVLELRLGLLGLLGEHFDKLPSQFYSDIIELCKASQYGSFAHFLLKLPSKSKLSHNKNKLQLLEKLMQVAHKKILTGNTNVATAVLQRLRTEKSDGKDVQSFLCNALKNKGENKGIQLFDRKVHIGYIEGLFAILFQQTKLAENGILNVFLILNQEYPDIADLLIQNNIAFKKFVTWLNLHSLTLFNEQDYLLWMTLCPELQKGSISKTTLSEKVLEDKNIGQETDRKLIKDFLSLFPYSDACCVKLTGEWQQYIELVKTLRRGTLAIMNNLKSATEIVNWIKEQQAILSKPIVKLPLLKCFEQLLFQAWQAELDKLRNTFILPRPILVDYSSYQNISLSIQVTAELKEAVGRFFQTIEESAYEHGVFCEVEHVLGSSRYLKPILRMGKPIELDNDLLSPELNSFITNNKQISLQYKQIEQFLIIPIISINPLFTQKSGIYLRQVDIPRDNYIPAFAFVFKSDYDYLAPQTDLRDVLCTIITQINWHISAQRNRRFKKRHNTLANLEQLYFNNKYYDEQGLFRAALDLTNTKSGLLAMEFPETNSLQVVASRGIEHDYLRGEYFQLNEVISNSVIRCWSDAKALFLPNFQKSQECTNFKIFSQKANQTESNIYKWLSDSKIASMIVLPIFAGFANKKVGVLVLSSQSPYFFTTERIAAIEQLLQKNRWAIEVVQLKEFQDYMQHLLVHEVRSEMVLPVKNTLRELNQDRRNLRQTLLNLERYADRIEDLIEHLLIIKFFDVSDKNYADKTITFKDAYSVIKKFIKLHTKLIEKQHQTILIEPGAEDLWHYAVLLGDKSAYERVVRVLLDNALKYGQENARIYISVHKMDKYWQLIITNPGHMATIENRVKFEPFNHPPDKDPNSPATGTHLGLAASKKIVEAHGGQLFVNNTIEHEEKRVKATLNWPFAKGENQ